MICETNILLLNGKSHVDAQDHEFQSSGWQPQLCCRCLWVLPLLLGLAGQVAGRNMSAPELLQLRQANQTSRETWLYVKMPTELNWLRHSHVFFCQLICRVSGSGRRLQQMGWSSAAFFSVNVNQCPITSDTIWCLHWFSKLEGFLFCLFWANTWFFFIIIIICFVFLVSICAIAKDVCWKII